MGKHFLASVCAIAALAMSQAVAQSPPAPTGGPIPPTTANPSLPSGPGGAVDGVRRPTSSAAPAASFVSRQATDQWLASMLMQKNMHGVDGQPVGEVKDILLDRSGSIAAIVVDVGGAVGAAGKIVAVPFSSIQVTRDSNNNDRLVLQATRTDLQNAPAFVSAQDHDSTIGAGAPGRAPDRSGPQGPSAR